MNKKKLTSTLFILIPAFWACLIDFLLTVINQYTEYWNGDLQMALERNPVVEYMMKIHTSGIFIFEALWLALIVTIGYFLPPKSVRILSLFVLIAHTLGASSWLIALFGFWSEIIFILFNSILFIVIDTIYISKIIIK